MVKCNICGKEFKAHAEHHYISRDDGKTGVVAAFVQNDETGLYDSFDCPRCGCQCIAQKRNRRFKG